MDKIDTYEIEMDGGLDQTTDNSIRPKKSSRQKILYSICIYGAFFMLGWNRSLFGPAFPDIQRICQVNLELGSWIPTTFFIGYTFGSLTGGLLEKFDQKLTFGISLVVLAIAVAATPWCIVFALMIVAHLVQGFFQGIVDTIGNSEILLMWKNSRLLFFCLELVYTIGSFTSPLVAASFLMDSPVTMEIPINVTAEPFQSYFLNISLRISFSDSSYHYYGEPTNETIVVSSIRPPAPETFKSMIYIPYSLTAFLVMCISIAFLVLYFVYKKGNNTDPARHIDITEPENQSRSIALTNGISEPEVAFKSERIRRELPAKVKGCCLATACGLLMFFIGVFEAFASYLTVFCVDYLQWTPADGALLTSITSMCTIVSIVVSLFMTCVNTQVYAGVNIVLVLLSFVGVLISSIYFNESGMWISCCVLGFFMAIFFSLVFTWINEYITPVTGNISSLLIIFSYLGAAVNPVILGNIMETFGDLWMCYLLVVEGFLVLFLYVALVGLTRYVVKHFGKTLSENLEIKQLQIL